MISMHAIRPYRLILATTCLMLALAGPARADMPDTLDGWWINATEYGYAELIKRVEDAVEDAPMGIVFRASPNEAARRMLDVELPGNTVIGVFAPNFAARLIETYLPAQIEAPLRLYITENSDGTATLSYRFPSTIFAAYPEGGPELEAIAVELDQLLSEIATATVAP